ncbi:MAG TPA: DUF1850 domain-containing protein [bacterium]|nr:DUF1850 domain-containing protein [bacterium]
MAVERDVELRLEYLHSVERTPVVEVYAAGRRGLRLVRMEFRSQGAGLPATGYAVVGDRLVLRTDRRLDRLELRVAGVNGARLITPWGPLDLVTLAGEGGLVTVAVRRLPRAVLYVSQPMPSLSRSK